MYVKDPQLETFFHCELACQLRADKERDSDGLLCVFPLILPNFALIFILISLLLLALVLQSQLLFYSVFCQVVELKTQLKLRSLPVSGTKNDLIDRLRTYQELSGGSDTTSCPTAGGTTGPGAEGAGRSSGTSAATTNNNTSQQQQQFQFQGHQTSSLTRQSGDCRLLMISTEPLL